MTRARRFVVLALVVLVGAFGVRACRNGNTLLRLAWPPADLYDELGSAPIDVGRAGSTVELVVVPRYAGAHDVDVHFPGQLALDGSLSWRLRVEIEVLDEAGKVLVRSHREGSPYWAGKRGSGLNFLRTERESEWRPGSSYRVRVTVVEPDGDLVEKYGAATVRVDKGSDE
ncbi:MAG: hypothetical protein AMXMBFR36_29180 [Acidobacteriota bacterium]